MELTLEQIKEELKNNYGYDNLDHEPMAFFIDEIIKDTLKIIKEHNLNK